MMGDETNGTRGSITPTQMFAAITALAKDMQQWQLDLSKENAGRDSWLARIDEQLRTIQGTLSRSDGVDAKVDNRLESIRDMLSEVRAAANELNRLVQEDRMRLGKLEDWSGRHDQFAQSRDEQIKQAAQSVTDLQAMGERFRVNLRDLSTRLDQHAAMKHLDTEVPDVLAMLKDWQDDRARARARWDQFIGQLWTAPGAILIFTSSASLGIWVQHAFHLVK